MDCEQLPDASEALLRALGPIICRACIVEQSESDSNICLKMKKTGFKVCCCFLFFSKAQQSHKQQRYFTRGFHYLYVALLSVLQTRGNVFNLFLYTVLLMEDMILFLL